MEDASTPSSGDPPPQEPAAGSPALSFTHTPLKPAHASGPLAPAEQSYEEARAASLVLRYAIHPALPYASAARGRLGLTAPASAGGAGGGGWGAGGSGSASASSGGGGGGGGGASGGGGGLALDSSRLLMTMIERERLLTLQLGGARAEIAELRAYAARLAAALADSIRAHQALDSALGEEETTARGEEDPQAAALRAELEEVASAVRGSGGGGGVGGGGPRGGGRARALGGEGVGWGGLASLLPSLTHRLTPLLYPPPSPGCANARDALLPEVHAARARARQQQQQQQQQQWQQRQAPAASRGD